MGLKLSVEFSAFYQHELLELAKKDLSLAHIKQHSDSAQLAVSIANIDNVVAGSYSVQKPGETVIFDQGYITGKKLWVSNIPYSSHTVLGVLENHKKIIVLVKVTDRAQIDMTPTVGMENTYTGCITFDRHPAIKLFDYGDNPNSFRLQHQTALGFLTNHYGLSLALFDDIDRYTQSALIKCDFDRSKIKLNLSMLDLLWNACLEQIGDAESDQLWRQINTVYGCAKQTLIMILKLIIEVSGSGLYEAGSEQHQRFKDALIYSTHMKNLYFSTKQNLY
jgi:hypothetical protein